MKFVNQKHEDFYNAHSDLISKGDDYEALVYTLGIDEECRKHFNDLYDSAKGIIRIEGLNQGWQTGASKRITRLAFHLFTWQVPEGEKPEDYLIKELFSSLDDSHRQGALLAIAYFA